jgi:hypothetical protein
VSYLQTAESISAVYSKKMQIVSGIHRIQFGSSIDRSTKQCWQPEQGNDRNQRTSRCTAQCFASNFRPPILVYHSSISFSGLVVCAPHLRMSSQCPNLILKKVHPFQPTLPPLQVLLAQVRFRRGNLQTNSEVR